MKLNRRLAFDKKILKDETIDFEMVDAILESFVQENIEDILSLAPQKKMEEDLSFFGEKKTIIVNRLNEMCHSYKSTDDICEDLVKYCNRSFVEIKNWIRLNTKESGLFEVSYGLGIKLRKSI